MKLWCAFAMAIALTCYSAANAQDAVSERNGLVDTKQFDQRLAALSAQQNLPGLAVAVVADNKVAHSFSYGFADGRRQIPIDQDTPFWVASLTKTFVGLVYLHLAAQEKVDLDERADKTPDFTGLCEWLASTTIPFAQGLNCDAPITIRNILHHQVNDKPGTQFMYNPIMYSRLSRHLEHKFGDGVDQVKGRHNELGKLITSLILQPAGMKNSMGSMWDRSRMAVFYDMADGFKVDENGNRSKMPRPDKHIAGGAGVVASVADLAKYELALSSKLITPGKIHDTLHTPARFNDGTVSPSGFGWYFQCYRGEQLMWHSGWDPDHGYSALHLRVPKRGLAFIALANGEGIWWENPLDQAAVEKSQFAQLFMKSFLFNNHQPDADDCE